MNTERVDVLAVMDAAADKIESYTAPCFDDCALREARAAVAELIAAANLTAIRAANAGFACDGLRAALARVGAA